MHLLAPGNSTETCAWLWRTHRVAAGVCPASWVQLNLSSQDFHFPKDQGDLRSLRTFNNLLRVWLVSRGGLEEEEGLSGTMSFQVRERSMHSGQCHRPLCPGHGLPCLGKSLTCRAHPPSRQLWAQAQFHFLNSNWYVNSSKGPKELLSANNNFKKYSHAPRNYRTKLRTVPCVSIMKRTCQISTAT